MNTLLKYIYREKAGDLAVADNGTSALYAWNMPQPPMTRAERKNKYRSLPDIASHFEAFSTHLIEDNLRGTRYQAHIRKSSVPQISDTVRRNQQGEALTLLLPLLCFFSRPLYVGFTCNEEGISKRTYDHLYRSGQLNERLDDLLIKADPNGRLKKRDFIVTYFSTDTFLDDFQLTSACKQTLLRDLERLAFHFEFPPLNKKRGN